MRNRYGNKDNLVNGDTSLNLNSSQRVNLTWTQKQPLVGKYTLTKGKFTCEPSYNFVTKAPVITVTKKQGKKGTVKVAFDLKSKAGNLELGYSPFKLTLGTSVKTSPFKVAKPNVAAVFENLYSF